MNSMGNSASLLNGAIVLAGGKSARMGQDKALLKVEHGTLLEQVVSVVRSLADEVVVVVDVEDKYRLPGCRVVVDAFPDTGPVGGILTGLMALEQGWHIVVACDMPCLQSDLIRFLKSLAADHYDAIVPVVKDYPEPLCALYRHTAIPSLQEFLEQGGRAAHKALERLTTLRVDEALLRRADPALASFININTPQEYRKVKIPRE